MLSAITAGIGLLGSIAKGFFGFKEHQADVVKGAIKTIGDVNSSQASREQAIAQIISSETNSGYWLAATWRPWLMVFLSVLIGLYFFGYATPAMGQPMPELVKEIFSLLKIGVMGYIPARTTEKIIEKIQIAKVLNTYIKKKLA